MGESADNIYITCTRHGSKPDPELAQMPPESFIGKWVYKTFLTGNDLVPTEHMWVKVETVENGRLVGTLANDPACCSHLYLGMRVEVEMQEIEKVYE
jgi:uncharacterized protein YegJ (DUF2314 family)